MTTNSKLFALKVTYLLIVFNKSRNFILGSHYTIVVGFNRVNRYWILGVDIVSFKMVECVHLGLHNTNIASHVASAMANYPIEMHFNGVMRSQNKV